MNSSASGRGLSTALEPMLPLKTWPSVITSQWRQLSTRCCGCADGRRAIAFGAGRGHWDTTPSNRFRHQRPLRRHCLPPTAVNPKPPAPSPPPWAPIPPPMASMPSPRAATPLPMAATSSPSVPAHRPSASTPTSTSATGLRRWHRCHRLASAHAPQANAPLPSPVPPPPATISSPGTAASSITAPSLQATNEIN